MIGERKFVGDCIPGLVMMVMTMATMMKMMTIMMATMMMTMAMMTLMKMMMMLIIMQLDTDRRTQFFGDCIPGLVMTMTP